MSVADEPRPSGGEGDARPHPTRRTSVFAKAPRAGAVKTRLVPPLTEAEAAELAEAMLADTLARASGAHAVELVVAPADALAWFRARFPGVPVAAQVGAGLAERLAHHFATRCGGATSEVVLGGDAPQVEDALVVRAHERLEAGADVVLGPDEGGGYWLVGMTRAHPELFTEVAMSTATMLDETIALARRRGLAVELLPRRADVDLPADLARLARALAARAATEPELAPIEPARAAAELELAPTEPARAAAEPELSPTEPAPAARRGFPAHTARLLARLDPDGTRFGARASAAARLSRPTDT